MAEKFLLINKQLSELKISLGKDIVKRIDFLFQRSDIAPLVNKGIPCVMFTDGPFSSFHSFNDKPKDLDYEKMKSLSQLIYETLITNKF